MQVVFPSNDDGNSQGEGKPHVVYHNIEKAGVLGVPHHVALTPGDENTKLYRTLA